MLPTLTAAVQPPADSLIEPWYAGANLADAFCVSLPSDASDDPELLAGFLLTHQPRWVGRLMQVRDALVAGLGLKTAKQLATSGSGSGSGSGSDRARPARIGIFKVYQRGPAEIILGEDDKHLDFRVSVSCRRQTQDQRSLVVTTVVRCHNRLGRVYLALIGPFHRRVVRGMLSHAARLGWPRR